jgi:hypothetical protein
MAKKDEKIITHISNFRRKRIPDVIKIFHKIQQTIPKLFDDGRGWTREGKRKYYVMS